MRWTIPLLLLVVLPVGAALGVQADVPSAGQTAATADASVWSSVLFYLFGGLAVLCCLGIVVSRNIVRTALWLYGVLVSLAALYFLLLANFLAVIQFIVYAGGILVLIVFGVMLTTKSPWARFDPKPIEVIGGLIVALVLFGGLSWVLVIDTDWSVTAEPNNNVFTVAELGNVLLTDYLVPFEVASVLLLAVMIGAAFLARPERR
jgi:NADH-quinone oxidoreductase subunit J